MASAKITLLGLAEWESDHGRNLFSKLTLPDGIDSDTLINNILLEGGEFEILYSRPDFMREAIGVWSAKYNRTFTKWVEALSISYEPLENYDRKEERSLSSELNANSNSNAQGTSNYTDSSEDNHSVTAYDSDTLHTQSKDTSSDSGNSTNTATDTTTATNTGTESETIRAHGNIGVTTSQQMLQSELEIAQWNIYEHITDLFLKEFCIMIY